MVTTFAAEDLQPIAQFQELKDAQEHALVVLAMNLDCLITIEEDQSFLIHSDPAFALAIHEEFRLYAEEQEEQNDPPHIPIFSSGLERALLWVYSLLFFFVQQDGDPGFTERYLNSSHALVEHHEFYRPFTALFLHGDLEHLLGNVVFGLIFCVLVANSVGPFLGWILVLTSGFLGNTLNSILHYPDQFLSLGASTATFWEFWLEWACKLPGFPVPIEMAFACFSPLPQASSFSPKWGWADQR